jgi:hypothetical protein
LLFGVFISHLFFSFDYLKKLGGTGQVSAGAHVGDFLVAVAMVITVFW